MVRLTVVDRWFAENAIRGPHPYTHLVSIIDSSSSGPVTGHLLHLSFDDILASIAAAYIILSTIYGGGSKAQALADVYHARPCARPNALMVQIADRMLRREGAMERQLEALSALRATRRT